MEKNNQSGPQLFHCPTCGASLPVPDAVSVRCEYCGSNVLVPPEYRPGKGPEAAPQVVIQVPEQSLAGMVIGRTPFCSVRHRDSDFGLSLLWA